MFFMHGRGVGVRGERHACRWLRRRGWNVIHRNHVIGHDEIDIVAETPDGRTISCIEVKSTRTAAADLFRRIDGAKCRCLKRSARKVASRHPQHFIRIDLMTVEFQTLFRCRIRHWPAVIEDRTRQVRIRAGLEAVSPVGQDDRG